MKLGAFDYFRKPVRTDEIRIAIRRALEARRLHREVARLRRDLSGGSAPLIVGKSQSMRRVMDGVSTPDR